MTDTGRSSDARAAPCDALDKACRKDFAMHRSYCDITFDRPNPGTIQTWLGSCLIRDFVARHNGTSNSTVLCAWNANWIKALGLVVSGPHSEHTSLLSVGADPYRVQYLRTDDPVGGHAGQLDAQFNGVTP